MREAGRPPGAAGEGVSAAARPAGEGARAAAADADGRAGGWRVLAGPADRLLDPAPDPGAAAVVVPSRDVFADPPALAVHGEVLAAVGGPLAVRAGALADLVDRLEEAGHVVERRPLALPPRPRALRSLLHEGSGRFWLWRRRPAAHPLPSPRDVGWWPYPLLALGALHANGEPTRPVRRPTDVQR